jgi:hypothetical protein
MQHKQLHKTTPPARFNTQSGTGTRHKTQPSTRTRAPWRIPDGACRMRRAARTRVTAQTMPSPRPVQPVPSVLHKLQPTLVQLARMCKLVRACVRARVRVCARARVGVCVCVCRGGGYACMPWREGSLPLGSGHRTRRRLVQQICSHMLHEAWQQNWRSASLGDRTPSSIYAIPRRRTRQTDERPLRGVPWACSGLATAGASAVPADPICRRAPGGRAPVQAAIMKLCRVGLLDSSQSL